MQESITTLNLEKERPAVKSLILSVAGGIFKMRSKGEQKRFSASFSQKNY